MHPSTRALHRANPRTEHRFGHSVESVRARTGGLVDLDAAPARRVRRRSARRFSLAAGSVAAGAVAIAVLSMASPTGGPGVVRVEGAAAAVREAASLTTAAAAHSGTASVRITHGGDLWAAKSVTWNGDDLSLVDTSPGRGGRAGSEMRVVDGILYAPDPEGPGWLRLGGTDSIDPGSGTMPAEYLAAARDDVSGTTLRRLSNGIAGLTAQTRPDGATVYTGTVAAGLVARKTGLKEGQRIRLLPFGYVAHDEAADPASLLQAELTVSPGGVVQEIAVSWGSWLYTVVYDGLGTTPAPVAPADARALDRHVSG